MRTENFAKSYDWDVIKRNADSTSRFKVEPADGGQMSNSSASVRYDKRDECRCSCHNKTTSPPIKDNFQIELHSIRYPANLIARNRIHSWQAEPSGCGDNAAQSLRTKKAGDNKVSSSSAKTNKAKPS